MGALSALRNLFASRSPLLALIDDPFVQIDRPALAAKLELEKRGAEQGAHDLPAPDTRTFDQVEAEIQSEIADEYKRAQVEAANQIRVYDNRLAELGLLAELSSIRSHARQAVGDFVAEVANSRNHLATSRDAIAERHRAHARKAETPTAKGASPSVPTSIRLKGPAAKPAPTIAV